MKYKFLSIEEKYDGAQLQSLRNYLVHGVLGDSVVAWIGPCDVTNEHMVDGEDLVVGARIAGAQMLHFIVEKFDVSLLAAVTLQRLMASIVKDVLQDLAPVAHRPMADQLAREGDDLYFNDQKLSISIATQSPVNSLIHFAVNVTNKGTPVKTLALEDLGIEPRALAEKVMGLFCREVESIHVATQKVRWVK